MSSMIFGLFCIFTGAIIYVVESILEYIFEDKKISCEDEEDTNLENILTLQQINEEKIKNDNKIEKIIENINKKNSQE